MFALQSNVLLLSNNQPLRRSRPISKIGRFKIELVLLDVKLRP